MYIHTIPVKQATRVHKLVHLLLAVLLVGGCLALSGRELAPEDAKMEESQQSNWHCLPTKILNGSERKIVL